MGDGPWWEGARAHESQHQAVQGGGYSVQEKESKKWHGAPGGFSGRSAETCRALRASGTCQRADCVAKPEMPVTTLPNTREQRSSVSQIRSPKATRVAASSARFRGLSFPYGNNHHLAYYLARPLRPGLRGQGPALAGLHRPDPVCGHGRVGLVQTQGQRLTLARTQGSGRRRVPTRRRPLFFRYEERLRSFDFVLKQCGNAYLRVRSSHTDQGIEQRAGVFMAPDVASTSSGSIATSFRILCGSLMLILSLISVVSSFRSAITLTGQDAVSLWGFFLWGLGLACGGVWLIRGRSKGKTIILAVDWKRLVIVAAMALMVVGILIFFLSQPGFTDDPVWWPLILQTMFANLFASLPFALFDREDYKERQEPTKMDAEGRRKAGRGIIVVAVVGAVLISSGIVVGIQSDSWWQDLLVQLGVALLAAAVFLWYRLRQSIRRDSGTES